MSYAQPSDLLARYDSRVVGDLVQDLGQRVSPAALLTDPNLQAALDDASGLLDSALLRGGRYLPADLTGLSPAGNSYKLLLRLACDLAYGLLLNRRTTTLPVPEQVKTAYALLDRLGEGTLVFGDIQKAVTAGKPINVRLDKSLSLITSLDRVFGDQTIDPRNAAVNP